MRDERGQTPTVNIAKFCHRSYAPTMGTMNISLPNSLKSFVDEQVSKRGYATCSEYVRDLIRADQDRERLRALLLDGAGSKSTGPVDDDYFRELRTRARQARAR